MVWKMAGGSGGVGQAVRGLGFPEKWWIKDGYTRPGQGISGRSDRLSVKGDRDDTGRSRCWVNHGLEEIYNERFHNGGA